MSMMSDEVDCLGRIPIFCKLFGIEFRNLGVKGRSMNLILIPSSDKRRTKRNHS